MHTIAVQNRHAGDAATDKLVDDIEHGRVHSGRLKVLIRTQIEEAQRFPKQLRLRDVDRNEFQNAILGDDADHHGTLGLIVDIDQGDTARTGLEHSATCFVERA
jgi:hypothetical protein